MHSVNSGPAPMRRRIAIAIPARDEADYIGACLKRLSEMSPIGRGTSIRVIILANNCRDATPAIAKGFQGCFSGGLEVIERKLPRAQAHAGWARRLALDAAAASLSHSDDLLMSTDADTLVDRQWLRATLAHIDAGYDAVAGRALLNPAELRRLPPGHRRRLGMIRRHENALAFLRAAQRPEEPWPRHFYEGGASIALTFAAYRAVGDIPTPPVGEDKALFDAVRKTGGKVRHPMDVRVSTSPRLLGRAPEGAADTLAHWTRQDEHDPIFGLRPLAAHLGVDAPHGPPLTFANLGEETARLRAMVREAREVWPLALAS